MASEELTQVLNLLKTFPQMMDMPVDQMRAFFDTFSDFFPRPEGIVVEGVNAGGVSAEWVRAAGVRNDTVILYLHGGGYVIGSVSSHRHLAAAISEDVRSSVLSLNYRLAPEHPFPAALEDSVMGYRWLLKQGVAPERIAVAGDSAGGGLTVASLLALREEGVRLPAAAVCMSPWVDLTCSSESYRTKGDADPLLGQKEALRLARMYHGDTDPRNPFVSPLFADLTGLPPMLIQVGSEEVLLDDAVGLHHRAQEAGIDSTLEVWDGMFHVWQMFYPMLKEGRDAIARIGKYLNFPTAIIPCL